MQTQGWGKQICRKPTGTLYECGEATLHQHPVWQPASDNVQLHSCSSESEIPPEPGRPGAEPGARDSRPRERRNLSRASHPAQLPNPLVSPPDIPDSPGPAAGPWHLPFPLPKPSLPPCLLLEGLFPHSGLSSDAPLDLPSSPPASVSFPSISLLDVVEVAFFIAYDLSRKAQGGPES